MPDPDGYQIKGRDGVYILVDRRAGDVAGAFYAEEGDPGWWRGHAHGRVKRVYAPGAEPSVVAGRFLS